MIVDDDLLQAAVMVFWRGGGGGGYLGVKQTKGGEGGAGAAC